MLRRPLRIVALTLIAAGFSSFATRSVQNAVDSDEQRVTPEAVVAGMDWLAGDWSGDMWGGKFHAHYSTPTNGMILSHSRLMRGSEVSFYEFEVFEARDELVFMQPYPKGQMAIGFQLTSLDPTKQEAVFENPKKDFPTHISYRRVDADRLLIVLSDPHGASDKVERFDLQRVDK